MRGERIRPCARCRRPTRPARALIADYPGTTIRQGELCGTCHTGGTTPPPPEPRMSNEENIATLAFYLRRRRDREEMMARREYYADRISA